MFIFNIGSIVPHLKNINIFQEKNLNLNRDSNLGPPQVQDQIFLLKSDNLHFPRHKL